MITYEYVDGGIWELQSERLKTLGLNLRSRRVELNQPEPEAYLVTGSKVGAFEIVHDAQGEMIYAAHGGFVWQVSTYEQVKGYFEDDLAKVVEWLALGLRV